MAGRPTDRQLGTLSRIANLVAEGTATLRSRIEDKTGLSRSSVAGYVDTLIAHRVLAEVEAPPTGRGRPALTLQLAAGRGLIAAIDLGGRHCSIALSDLPGALVAETTVEIDMAAGPEKVLGRAHALVQGMLRKGRRRSGDIRMIGIGVPGPVEAVTGTVVRPPIMPGWDGYRVPEFFAAKYDAPVLVDNDVNIMAVGELPHHPEARHLLFVKVGTGIGCGIVSDGTLHRGASGAAGDIGHVVVPGHDDIACRCGNTGCLEAIASGAAVAAALRQKGLPAHNATDVVRLVHEGDAQARRQVRLAGRRIGEVLATLVSFHNPDAVVVGGVLATLHEDLLADIRGVVYRRALPLATRTLAIEASTLGPRAAVSGARLLALRALLSPSGLARVLSSKIAR